MSHLSEDQLAQLNQVRTVTSLPPAYFTKPEKKCNCGKCECKKDKPVNKVETAETEY